MKALKTLKAAYDSAKVRAITAAVGALTAPSAFAITKTDLTQDTSGGKTASDVMTNIDGRCHAVDLPGVDWWLRGRGHVAVHPVESFQGRA